jgi:hypothetical protein
VPAHLARGGFHGFAGLLPENQDSDVVIISRQTSDGGRAGVKTQVPRAVAARIIADEKADLATAEEAEEFRAATEAKWKRI